VSAAGPPPTLVVLDLDDTLIDYVTSHEVARRALLRRAEQLLRLSRDDIEKAFDEGRLQIKDQVGPTAASHNRLLYLQRGLELLGLGPQVETAVALERTYWRTLLLASRVFPGAVDFLIAARAAGATLALVTDLTAEAQFEKLLFFSLDRLVDVLVTSEEAGGDKVTGKPLDVLLTKLPASALAGSAWSVGDAEHDLSGPKQLLGATTYQRLVKPWSPRHPSADVVFTEFTELTADLHAGDRR
jgi:FMN phosphatase YigB (HAD superfamily)